MMQILTAELALHAQATLAEGPVWDAGRKVLWWIDIEPGKVHKFCPSTGTDAVCSLGYRVGAIALREKGGLLVAGHRGVGMLDPESGQTEIQFHPEADQPENRFNDGKCDPRGRYWGGTMNLDPGKFRTGAFYSVDPQRGIRKFFDGVGCSNGLAWSSDARTMYYIDSMIKTVDAFDFDAEHGEISNRRVVFRVPDELGIADGMTIDAEDKLWVAFWGGWCVARIDPSDGKVLARIEVPTAHVTACTFAGDNLDQLYITTARHCLDNDALQQQPHAGDLFVAAPGTRGLAPVAYRG